ncbi:MAG: DUF3322 domain-containing protein [Azoarcus sp.]|nr:DUF3322 domain-containing protein [Azoarcus sp.]
MCSPTTATPVFGGWQRCWWLANHPNSQLCPRQLPVSGLDSK